MSHNLKWNIPKLHRVPNSPANLACLSTGSGATKSNPGCYAGSGLGQYTITHCNDGSVATANSKSGLACTNGTNAVNSDASYTDEFACVQGGTAGGVCNTDPGLKGCNTGTAATDTACAVGNSAQSIV